jgi:uncharacterized membrane protein
LKTGRPVDFFQSSTVARQPEMRAASKPQRVVFLDLLRALAVVMMVQGHTIDLLLANEYRSS